MKPKCFVTRRGPDTATSSGSRTLGQRSPPARPARRGFGVLQAVPGTGPSPAMPCHYIGQLLQERGRYDEAARLYEAARASSRASRGSSPISADYRPLASSTTRPPRITVWPPRSTPRSPKLISAWVCRSWNRAGSTRLRRAFARRCESTPAWRPRGSRWPGFSRSGATSTCPASRHGRPWPCCPSWRTHTGDWP